MAIVLDLYGACLDQVELEEFSLKCFEDSMCPEAGAEGLMEIVVHHSSNGITTIRYFSTEGDMYMHIGRTHDYVEYDLRPTKGCTVRVERS